jgi:hypothetical protein
MEFRRELHLRPFPEQINIRQKLMLLGSCFTDKLGDRLAQHRFTTLQNPNGILFNPVSIANAVASYISGNSYGTEDIFLADEHWTSWDHHSLFSHQDPQRLLDRINQSVREAHHFLNDADWLILTLGSAWVYQLDDGRVVANCHKVPADRFRKTLMPVEDVLSSLDNMIHRLSLFNPRIRIVFTISPVRHLRDGFIENNRSKAVLIQAVHHLVNKFNRLHYFPAYELVIDDLRDYRFYAEDMVHPNYLATDYVWQKFREACIDEPSARFMKDIAPVNAALAHKPFFPDSMAHRNFRKKMYEKIQALKAAYPFADLEKDLEAFRDQ